MAYLGSNETGRAEKILQELNSQRKQISQAVQIYLSQLYIKQRELYKAKMELNDLLLFNSDLPENLKKEIYKNLIYIALLEHEPNDVINYSTLTKDSTIISETKAITQLPKKNVLLSQVLSSIIPGSGEIYCGRFGSGLLSFFVNSASVFGIVYTYKHKQYVDATLIFSLIFTRFYNGSRNNARNFAQEYNNKIYQTKLKDFNTYYK